ncbi:glutathione S-transferase, partial [Lecanoromycetidae sp. Uapishka_2]
MASTIVNGSSGSSSNGTNNGLQPKITLYTNHGCPWAHRAHITLRELGLPYEEVIIPLDRPRDPWYLEINPRGLVPSIKISNGLLKDEIITESAIVSTFLADNFPNPKFYPASRESPTSALTRARIGFFVDTWFTKVNPHMYPVLMAEGEEKEKLSATLVAAIKKEIEPLLDGAGPFFGGSESMTLAEALTAPFVIRFRSSTEAGLIPASSLKELDALPKYGKWSKTVCEQDSVTYIFDGPNIAKHTKERVAKMKAERK